MRALAFGHAPSLTMSGDAWKAMVQPHWERLREMYHAKQFSSARRDKRANDIVNREFIREEKDFPSAQCMEAGLDFLARNASADNWLLQIETFDPHEPFHAPARFREGFPTGYRGPVLDWPRYGRVGELPEECEELRANYYATVAHCDELLGGLLDAFDAGDLWKDTALVVTTDHGFLLGEHDFWAKNRMNLYREVEHIPLLVHDPRAPARPSECCDALTQTTDLAATPVRATGLSVSGVRRRAFRPPPDAAAGMAGSCCSLPCQTTWQYRLSPCLWHTPGHPS